MNSTARFNITILAITISCPYGKTSYAEGKANFLDRVISVCAYGDKAKVLHEAQGKQCFVEGEILNDKLDLKLADLLVTEPAPASDPQKNAQIAALNQELKDRSLELEQTQSKLATISDSCTPLVGVKVGKTKKDLYVEAVEKVLKTLYP